MPPRLCRRRPSRLSRCPPIAFPTDAPEVGRHVRLGRDHAGVGRSRGGGERGLGYTYADTAAARLIHDMLRRGGAGPRCHGGSGRLGRDGPARSATSAGRASASMAISAVDAALWDLKARLLGLPLVTLLGAARDRRAGLRQRRLHLVHRSTSLHEQLGGWAEQGFPRVKMKVGTRPGADPERVEAAREAIGDGSGTVRGRQRRLRPQAGPGPGRRVRGVAACTWFEEPVSSDDLDGPAPAPRPGAGGHGHRGGRVRLRPDLFPPHARRRSGGRAAGRRHPLRRASPASSSGGAVRGVSTCRCRRTAAPSLHLHPCCAAMPVRHLEYFHDHARIEHMLFDGAPTPVDGQSAARPLPAGAGSRIQARRRRPVCALKVGQDSVS